MRGTIINAASIIGGGMLGLLLKRGIPESYQQTVMRGIGLAIIVIGAQMALQGNMLIVISSVAIGGLAGEFLALDRLLAAAGEWLSKMMPNQGSAEKQALGKGFITATLVYCVGSMSVVGSVQDGLTGKADILLVKAMLDGITAVFFASALGAGVLFSALPVFLYQGAITVMAGFMSGFLPQEVIAEMSAAGGVLIMGIAFTMLGVCEIKIANLLPALFFAAIIAAVCQ
ncbi:MAG: DUF554 domain-containing protein [Acidaminococcales bacterium]|jgi:uncharacterized membrane protein YqgA involved in biofilm formation|nr:DUF554 domain-containing protein [Acidaminococcales bacterium]